MASRASRRIGIGCLGGSLRFVAGIEMGESSEAATVTYPAIPPAPSTAM